MTIPCAVVLSVCIIVGNFLYPIYSGAWRSGMASLQLMNSDPSSASAADYMMALVVFEMVHTSPFWGGGDLLLDINKCPPALLMGFFQRDMRHRCGLLGPYHSLGV